MPVITRAAVGLFVGIVLVALSASPGLAFHGPAHFANCVALNQVDASDTDCIVFFGLGIGIPFNAPPAGVSLDVFNMAGAYQIQVQNANNFTDPSELSPALTTSTQLIFRIRFGASFTPAVVIGAAHILFWYWDAPKRELTVFAEPRPSSWVNPTCLPGNCPSPATNDYTAMALFAADDTTAETAPPDAAAHIAAFLTKYKGGFMSTNAQYFALPFFNFATNAVEFDLGAPHLKNNGSVNTGFFRVFVPDLVISDLWGLDPATLTASSVTVTMDGVPTTVTSTRIGACEDLILVGCPANSSPPGWLYENTSITYSTPRVSIAPVAAASVPDQTPFVPVSVPETAKEGDAPLDLGSTVRVAPSGKVGVPVTLAGAGAKLGIAAGTSLKTSLGAFAGDIIPPFRVSDPTGGKLASVTTLIASGLPAGVGEVTLSEPAKLTLPLPAGASASRYQPVEVDRSGKLKFLSGQAVAGGVALDVDRLGSATLPWQRAYGLAEIPAPAVQAVTPSVVTQPGHHSRWAGQSGATELAPAQLADVTVRLLNGGDQPWVRGALGKQVNLGSSPIGSTADVESGIVLPLWGRDRFATTNESVVNPGEYGTLTLRVRAPTTPGTYRIYMRPVVDGTAWLHDQGIYVEVTVR